MKRIWRGLWLAGVCAVLAPTASHAGLVAFYDFNDASNPAVAKDVSGRGNNGVVMDAVYSADKGGHTGKAGDRAMDFGEYNNDAYVDLVTAADGAFDSLAETDKVTVSVWVLGDEGQPYDQWNFYAGPYRQLGSHVPWSNSNIYFDVAGTADSACCGDRISTFIDYDTFAGSWNHYTYVKDTETSRIYQNGQMIIEGGDMRPMNPITEFFIGVGPEGDRRSYGGMMDDFGVWDNAMTDAEVQDLFKNGPKLGGGKRGDFNLDGTINEPDVNLLSGAIKGGTNPASFDLTKDGKVDGADLDSWVRSPDIAKTWFGDANLDGVFNTQDFVRVFQVGKFEVDAPALWSEGDWTADQRFNTSDFVKAFQDGGFEAGPRAAVSSVPEPNSLVLLALGAGLALRGRRRR